MSMMVHRLAGCAALLLASVTLLPAQEPIPTPAPPRAERGTVLERVPENGRYDILMARRARLGVTVNMRAGDTDSVGALLSAVTPNGPAAKAGLKSGDIIIRFNGEALVGGDLRVSRGQSAPGLALTMLSAGIDPGDTVTIQYLRGKDRKNTSLVAGDEPVWTWGGEPPGGPLGEPAPEGMRGPPEGWRHDMRMQVFKDSTYRRPETYMLRTPMARIFMFGSPLADLELAPLNPDLGRYFGTTDGVLVINVPDGLKLGLKPGDVVFTVDGRTVTNPSQLLRVLQSYEPGETFKLSIMRMKKKEMVAGSVGER
jgi:membrane-associated protease RseP (regulator of RpoE activity)